MQGLSPGRKIKVLLVFKWPSPASPPNRQHEAVSLYLRNPPRSDPEQPIGVQYLIFDLQQKLQQINTEKWWNNSERVVTQFWQIVLESLNHPCYTYCYWIPSGVQLVA